MAKKKNNKKSNKKLNKKKIQKTNIEKNKVSKNNKFSKFYRLYEDVYLFILIWR